MLMTIGSRMNLEMIEINDCAGMKLLLGFTVMVVMMITAYFMWAASSLDHYKQQELISLMEKLKQLEQQNERSTNLMRQVFGDFMQTSTKNDYQNNCSQCSILLHNLNHKIMSLMSIGFEEPPWEHLKTPVDVHEPAGLHLHNPNKTNPIVVVQGPQELPHYRLAIGILSTYDRGVNRQTIRSTWLNYLDGTPYAKYVSCSPCLHLHVLLSLQPFPPSHAACLPAFKLNTIYSDWTYRFILGDTNDTQAKQQALLENITHGDMEFIPVFDTYRNITWKTLHIMKWATQSMKADYVMKIDDDSFLRLDRLILDLQRRPATRVYFGKSHGKYRPDRNPKSPYVVYHFIL
jgi:hypothetical protein